VALAGLDACCEPVLDLDEVSRHPQVMARRLIEKRKSGVEVRPAVLVRDDWRRLDAPGLGEHTAEVLNEVGVEARELAELRRQGVV
jgi:crotonobetainyl-CoA:carnitine CoA-transferase CaiB-like acyl-CoA transferase